MAMVPIEQSASDNTNGRVSIRSRSQIRGNRIRCREKQRSRTYTRTVYVRAPRLV